MHHVIGCSLGQVELRPMNQSLSNPPSAEQVFSAPLLKALRSLRPLPVFSSRPCHTINIYDIEAGQVVISRDVNFDESAFGLSPPTTDEDANDLDFDSLELDDTAPGQAQYKQTGKTQSRPNDEEVPAPLTRTVRQRPGLEESSAPDNFTAHQEEDEETKNADASTPPVFWSVSANDIETAVDLSEPSTFEAAVSGPDQVHWREAIQAKLESMPLRGVFRAAKMPQGHRAIGTK